jgi:hypothetical protein
VPMPTPSVVAILRMPRLPFCSALRLPQVLHTSASASMATAPTNAGTGPMNGVPGDSSLPVRELSNAWIAQDLQPSLRDL